MINIKTRTAAHPPLHVAPLGPAESHNALLGKHVQRKWVYSLLVDDHKPTVSPFTHFLLQLDDFAHAFIDKSPLSFHQLFPFLCTLVEKSRVDLTRRNKIDVLSAVPTLSTVRINFYSQT